MPQEIAVRRLTSADVPQMRNMLAMFGGWAIDRWGLAATGWVPIAFSALVVVLSALLVRLASRRPRPVEQRCESVG